jgi:hypothetical protein
VFERGHALLIGVSTYQYLPHLDVPTTAADAQALADVIRDPLHCGYPDAQVAVLLDATATHAHILNALDTLASRCTERDTIFLFYSGHGHFKDGQYYLTTHDTRLADDGKILAGSALSHQELLGMLQALRAERVVLVFNACHAGAISPTLDGADEFATQSLPQATAAALLATGTGRVIITACREHQFSFVGDGELTIFAQALVDAMRGHGIANRAGYVSVFDVYMHLYDAVGSAVRQQVPQAIRERYGEQQEPELTILKGVGPFAVALHGEGQLPGNAIANEPPPDGAAVRAVSPAESQAAYLAIQSGGISFGQGTSISGSIVGGDQRTIHTGGDSAGGDIDKRQGVFISGGAISGPVIGYNTGTLHIGANPAPSAAPDPLRQACLKLEHMIAHMQTAGDDDLADDLQSILHALTAATKARDEGKHDRQAAKIQAARAALRSLAASHAELGDLLRAINGIT